MSDWDVSTAQRSTFDATSHVAGAMEGMGGQFNQGPREIIATEYDVVGMNAEQIPAMRDAIREYVDKVVMKLEDIETGASSDVAFRNEAVQGAVKEYLGAVKESMIVLVTQLNAFSDKLADVYNSWLASAERYAEDVISVGSSQVANATQARYEETVDIR